MSGPLWGDDPDGEDSEQDNDLNWAAGVGDGGEGSLDSDEEAGDDDNAWLGDAKEVGGSALEQTATWLSTTTGQFVLVGSAAAVVVIGLILSSWLLYGLLSGVAVAVGLVVGAVAPWGYVRVAMAPLFKGSLSTAFFILLQLTNNQSALIERADSGYEWRLLRRDDGGLYATLSDGQRVDIDGDVADLKSVAWGKLAVVSQKTERNLGELTVEDWAEQRPDPVDRESSVDTPLVADGGDGGWHLDASKMERLARGSGGNELARNGRRKALEEKGGQQQLSQLWTSIGAVALLVLGFVLGFGALMLS